MQSYKNKTISYLKKNIFVKLDYENEKILNKKNLFYTLSFYILFFIIIILYFIFSFNLICVYMYIIYRYINVNIKSLYCLKSYLNYRIKLK